MARMPEWPTPLREARDNAARDPHSGFGFYVLSGENIGGDPGDVLLANEVLSDAKHRLIEDGRYVRDAKAIRDPVRCMAWIWLDHAQHHLGAQLNTYLRGDETGVDPVKAALVTVQAIARGLETAAEYLDEAALRLKDRSDAHGASVTHEHAREIWASHMAIVSDPDPDPDPDPDLAGGPSG